ncbi:hypothetical protein [Thiolapillus brandeum]|uniref:Glycosyltransferase RgtA/B/C/D-like domain-containing protein n=1 Tax=Thiolapillus brandeum TaxID=1076588 RepID=A0A7U6JIQ1_9GAMM|nr:hypothetical protein [Thiolapillus brandeum]BAO45531.1 conserved hypothetical protein [Thiolapillus brandeum]
MTGLLLALCLPPALGIAWLSRYWKSSHWSAIAGYGFLLGILATTLLMQLWNALGLKLAFYPMAAILAALTLLAFYKRPLRQASTPPPSTPVKSVGGKWLFWLLAGLLLLQYGGILLEIIWRPLYPWDAWMNWAPKARVWFEFRELVPWISRAAWLHLEPGELAYTLGNPKASLYPPLVPLVQTWMALGLGAWNDSLINLPWLLCSITLGLGLYGQARNLGSSPLSAMLVTFGVLSLPYVSIHTALAGYADLWLSTFISLGAIAFFLWTLTRDPRQLILAILMAIAATQTKVPGIAWVAMLILAWLLSVAPRITITGILGGILVLSYLWISGGTSMDIPLLGRLVLSPERITLPGIDSFTLDYHPVWKAFWQAWWVQGSWLFFGWLFPLVLIYAIFSRRLSPRLLPATFLVVEAFLFLFITFFFTYHYASALDGTTINRATLHMVPMLFFYLLLLFQPKETANTAREHLHQ